MRMIRVFYDGFQARVLHEGEKTGSFSIIIIIIIIINNNNNNNNNNNMIYIALYTKVLKRFTMEEETRIIKLT